MKVIKIEPNPSGSRPGLMDWNKPVPPAGWAFISDEHAAVFYSEGKECAGFVKATFEDNQCVTCEWNEEAYQEYLASLPEPTEVVEVPSQLDQIEAQVTYTAMMTDTLLEV